MDPGDPDLSRLNALLEVGRHAPFQAARLPPDRLETIADLTRLPLTTKDELVADQVAHPPFGTNLSFPRDRYTRLHQTSGTAASTLRVLETPEDWRWWTRSMARAFRAAEIGGEDRAALAYSFGPHVQFWASYDGVQELGALAISLGGMDSPQRLRTIATYEATALLCTPSYALHLASVAGESGLKSALRSVRRIVCTGEPGASVMSVRQRIEDMWDARCFDYGGATEAGMFACPCAADGGLHLLESDFICEVLDPDSERGVGPGEYGELVVTCLERRGFPVIRYRTGDIIRYAESTCSAGHPGRWLPDGIAGRVDDMVVIRGMNVFPSSIEETVRQFPGVGEFKITFYSDPRAMDEIKLEIELADASQVRDIQASLRQSLGLRVRMVPLKPGILPVHEGKARRVVDLRGIEKALASHGTSDTRP